MISVIDVEKRITCWNGNVPGEFIHFYERENGKYLVGDVTTSHHLYNSQNDPVELPPEIKHFFILFALDYQPGILSHPKIRSIAKVVGF